MDDGVLSTDNTRRWLCPRKTFVPTTLHRIQSNSITSDCNWARTHIHLVCKWTLNHLARLPNGWPNGWPAWPNGWVFVYKLSGCGFESSYSHLNFRFQACFGQVVPWHSSNYGVWIHSESRTWHDKNIQLNLLQFGADE